MEYYLNGGDLMDDDLHLDYVFRRRLLEKLDERNRYLKVIAKVIDYYWGPGEYEKEFK